MGARFLLLPLVAAPFLQTPRSTPEERAASWQRHLELERTSPHRDLTWRPLGPRFQGGRIESIAVHPDRPHVLLVGVGAGGVWKSEDGGLTWRHVFAREPTMAVGDVAIAPSDPDVVWLGTGEAHLSGTSYAGSGLFRSDDGGETWRPAGLAAVHHVGQVVVHPTDPERVWVAAIGPRSGGGPDRGVFATDDGGASWERVLFVDEHTAVIDLVMHPRDPAVLWAASWSRGGGATSGVWRTRDGGASWERLEGGLPQEGVGRVAVDVSRSDPDVVVALVTPADADRSPGRGRVFRSADGGDSWERTHADALATYVGWDFCDVRVAPDDPDEIWVCGLRLLRSRDGGASFERAGETVLRLLPHGGRGMHLDVHDLWIDPTDPDRLLMGNDGGLYASWDRGDAWLHLNVLPIAEFYRVRLDDEQPFRIWGGTQDNASLFAPSTAAVAPEGPDPWRHVFLDRWAGGDGFATFPDPFDGSIVYYECQNGSLQRRHVAETVLGGRDVPICPRAGRGAPRLRFAWDTPFLASPHAEGVLYCASQRVHRTADRGDTWEAISPDLTLGDESDEAEEDQEGRGAILDLALSGLDPELLIAGAGEGLVWVTRDGGERWKRVDADMPACAIGKVAASPHDPAVFYVTQSGTRHGDFRPHAFRFEAFGATGWSIAAGLPEHEPVNVVREDPVRPGLLYAGTDLGVYASPDGGASWVSLCATLPTAAVVDLAAHPRDPALVVVTHGLSAFLLDVSALRGAR